MVRDSSRTSSSEMFVLLVVRRRFSFFDGSSLTTRNLTTLAPDIVETILEDALLDHLTLFDIAVVSPALWEEQRTIMTEVQRSQK